MALFKNKKSSAKTETPEESVINLEKEVEQKDEASAVAENTDTNTDESTDDLLEERDMFDNGEDEAEETRDINDIVDEVIDYFTIAEPIRLNMLERGKLRKEIFIGEVKAYIAKIVFDPSVQEAVFKGFSSFVWSYDILDELIADNDVSDIKVYGYNHIRVKRLGKREGSTLSFRSEKHYVKFVEHVALKNKVSISDQNAAQNFVDKESCPEAILRFNITTGFINSSGKPILHIRKIPKTKLSREQLIELGFFDAKTADYLEKRIEAGEGFLFCGKGASGKTTCMNYLIDLIPDYYSGLVIQENEELFSGHPDIAFEHTVTNRGEGKIEYTLQDLARNGLLTDIDFFIIGEIKGGEALYLLNAVYTGARGWASVHGASATEAMKKLVDYIKYNSDYTQEEALQMLLHLNTVVFMENFKVKEITEVIGYDEQKGDLIYNKVL